MAGKDDDIERLLREMESLSAQADAALGGDDSAGKEVAKRRSSEPAPTPAQDEPSGVSPALVRALAISGVATGAVTLLFYLVAILPFFARPGLSDILAIFVSSLVVALVYTMLGRRRS
jgi:hypothetical protein